jgi:hypothetical protein
MAVFLVGLLAQVAQAVAAMVTTDRVLVLQEQPTQAGVAAVVVTPTKTDMRAGRAL